MTLNTLFKVFTLIKVFEPSSKCLNNWRQQIIIKLLQWSVDGLYDHETYLGVSCHLNASIKELIKVLAELP